MKKTIKTITLSAVLAFALMPNTAAAFGNRAVHVAHDAESLSEADISNIEEIEINADIVSNGVELRRASYILSICKPDVVEELIWILRNKPKYIYSVSTPHVTWIMPQY